MGQTASPAVSSGRFVVAPKGLLDLHLHLDGSISVKMAKALAHLQGLSLPVKDEHELKTRLRCPKDCQNLDQYLACFALPLSLLQTPEAIAYSVHALLEELAQEGLLYAEIRFAPQLHCEKGLTQEEAVEAALSGLRRSKLPANLILCAMRAKANERENEETLRLTGKWLGQGVVALDLAGSEAQFPTRDFAPLFARARAEHIPFVIHAGEADGAQSIRAALEFGAKRIGHGVRCLEDRALVEQLRQKQIPLTLCPTSNLNTRVFDRLEQFPLLQLLDAGVVVTINTDNRSVSDTTVRRELQLVCDAFHLSATNVHLLLQNAVTAAFVQESVKRKIRQAVSAVFPQLAP